MTLDPEDRERHALFKEAVLQAVLRQEEAIADFMRSAALHLQISLNTRSNDRGENAPSDLHALSDTLVASARIAEALASLQGTTRELVDRLGVGQEYTPQRECKGTNNKKRTIRHSSAEKAAPAWLASPQQNAIKAQAQKIERPLGRSVHSDK